MKDEILTYEEILNRFPDEWVILLDVELDKKTGQPLRGKVAYHDKEMEKAYQALERYKEQSLSFFFTGDIPEDMEAILHCL